MLQRLSCLLRPRKAGRIDRRHRRHLDPFHQIMIFHRMVKYLEEELRVDRLTADAILRVLPRQRRDSVEARRHAGRKTWGILS